MNKTDRTKSIRVGRENEIKAHDLILSAADKVFYSEGIRAVGVDRLCQEAGVAKATLYNNFKNKDDIVVSYLKARHKKVISSLSEPTTEPNWKNRILHLFNLLDEKASAPAFRGCAFLLAASEYPESGDVLTAAQNHKRAIRELIASHIPQQIENRLSITLQIAALYDGALAFITINRDSSIVKVTQSAANVILNNCEHHA